MKITNWWRKFGRCTSSRRQHILASLAAAGMAGTGSLAQADISSTLTGLTTPGNVDVPAGHGDTAETTLVWDTYFDQYGVLNYAGGWNGRGDVYQMEYDTQQITFTPTAANIKITIDSFELDKWGGGGDMSSTWAVTGSSSGLIASGLWDTFSAANDPGNAGGRSLVSPMASGVPGETVTLSFENVNVYPDSFDSYLALDNLTFSSMIIPEPATAVLAWLGVGGLGAMAMRRKRK